MRRFLVPYALSRCTEEEQVVFEAHILDCDACFEDLKALDRTRHLIREFVEGAPGVVQDASRVLSAQRRRRRVLLAVMCIALFGLGLVAGLLL